MKYQRKLTETILKTVELNNSPELILSYDILNKISYLCEKINDVEWSGILFYSTEGSIKYPDNLKLIAEDIFLMDKGSRAYTEYETNSDLIKYIMKNNLQELQRAHIHSHNNMKTFFSLTDMEELHDNSKFYNYYLSFIVNNSGDMSAKIAIRGNRKVKSNSILSYNNEDGKLIKTTENESSDELVLFILDCNIIKAFDISDDFKILVKSTIEKNEQEKLKDSYTNNYELKNDAEELLVELLSEDTSIPLQEILRKLDKEDEDNIAEYMNDIEDRIAYTLIGTNKTFILTTQIQLLKRYEHKYSIVKQISKVLKEYKDSIYEYTEHPFYNHL